MTNDISSQFKAAHHRSSLPQEVLPKEITKDLDRKALAKRASLWCFVCAAIEKLWKTSATCAPMTRTTAAVLFFLVKESLFMEDMIRSFDMCTFPWGAGISWWARPHLGFFHADYGRRLFLGQCEVIKEIGDTVCSRCVLTVTSF